MEFEFNPEKSIANKRKHGVSLEEAVGLWSVANVQIKARISDEPRFMIIGKLGHKFYSCIYTVRGESIRLISARRSRAKEEEIYHEHIRQKKSDS